MAKKTKKRSGGAQGAPSTAPAKPATRTILVRYHDKAVEEYEAIKDRQQRRAILTVASHLRRVGHKLGMPHAKSVQGSAKLRELRPSGGQSTVRPLYAEISGEFIILCVAPESEADPGGFRRGVRRAQERARDDYGIEV